MLKKKRNICKRLGDIPIHQNIGRLRLSKLMWASDGVSLYPSAMWVVKWIYPKSETGYAFRKDVSDELYENFNAQTFLQGSAIIC